MALPDLDSLWVLCKASLGFLLALAIAEVISFITTGWRYRALVSKLQRAGKPMPDHSPILGHLLAAKVASEELPRGAHSSYITDRLAKKLGADAYYFDTYPINAVLLIVNDPYIANQALNHPRTNAEKPPGLADWFAPISGRGGMNLFTQNGQLWKHDHDIFLPFFNNGNLDAAMPFVIKEMLVLRDVLRRKTKAGELFRLEPLTLMLMNDITGRIVFNAELGNQTSGPHPLSKTMLRQLSLKFVVSNVMDNLGQLNPLRSFETWNNGRLLDKHIKTQIQKRLDVYRNAKTQDDQSRFNSILDQAFEVYYSQPGRQRSDALDDEFLTMLCAQLRMFFFAGYDSTSATMIASVYLIWKHPDVLARLRTEHDQVFGPHVPACPDMIAENPSILNSLTYTNAVIKETLRLFPPANGIRMGSKDLILKGRDNTEYPTENVAIQMNHLSIMRNPKAWVRPLEFVPDRFLVSPDHELYPPKGAWRPFEFGVRNCTGQAFVMKELRAFLAIFAREFDFKECYDEVYADEDVDLTNVDNEKAFLITAGAAHPRGEFPCRISLSKYASDGVHA
ncbi:cytochrome P450 [Biscogniauxia mediterranea]|nr:cytochrome P450 [Biscogniauxia mediterranea]